MKRDRFRYTSDGGWEELLDDTIASNEGEVDVEETLAANVRADVRADVRSLSRRVALQKLTDLLESSAEETQLAAARIILAYT